MAIQSVNSGENVVPPVGSEVTKKPELPHGQKEFRAKNDKILEQEVNAPLQGQKDAKNDKVLKQEIGPQGQKDAKNDKPVQSSIFEISAKNDKPLQP